MTRRHKRSVHTPSIGVVTAPLLLAAALTLCGCTSHIADSVPAAVGGLPENVPARPATPSEFPAVHDRPPARAEAPLSEAESKRLKEDLIAARDRAARRAQKTEPATTGSTPAAGSADNP